MIFIRLFLLFNFFCLIFAVNANAKSIEYLNSKFCKNINFNDSGVGHAVDYSFPEVNKRKVFVGESIAVYNEDDYDLWIYSHDFQMDGISDLVAIDWHQRRAGVFYLAFYIFKDEGYLFSDKKSAKAFFKEKKLYKRHGSGDHPLIPEVFHVKYNDGSVKDEYFDGYHRVIPISIDGAFYIYAEKEISNSKRILIFDIAKGDVRLSCIYDI